MKTKRKVEVVVISDVHLGTYGCHAKQLLTYLSSISPKKLILNGDIIDIWQFKKRYFPKSHLRVIKKIMDMAADGVEIIYITGNHDEMLRKFSDTTIGNITIVDKIVLELDGKKAWFFHGDIFDVSIQNAKWLAKLGGYGYDLLIRLNSFVNWCSDKIGKEKYSLSKKIKNSVKGAIKYINDFEKVASDLAIENGYDYVICGHIHQPKMVKVENKHGKTTYLNSGDWIENFTALEYQFKRWKIYNYNNDKLRAFYADQDIKDMEIKDLIAAITVIDPNIKKSKSSKNSSSKNSDRM
ncbi:UDP-2,3-diacylglucosamine diphosphatase [Psychroserpens sp. AS72]|uniref:UDP-2,3-diacylglucosamine diphosphatase n=1 Tax=Psychroserpens sp. AS72 TaxID=3135775 RepID=UPI00316C622E